MASQFAVPIMSSIDSSSHVRGHNHSRSHQRSSQHPTHPFSLPRIPSERFDPRSLKHDHNSAIHENDQKGKGKEDVNLLSFATNRTRSSPSLHTNGHLKSSSPTEVATQHATADDVSQPKGHHSTPADARNENSMASMASRSRWGYTSCK